MKDVKPVLKCFSTQTKEQEGVIPKEMLEGVVPIGVVDTSDPKILYWDHHDVERFIQSKVIMGAPGSGKTTYLQLLTNRYAALKQSVFVFDAVRQCEFTKELEASLEPGTYEIWDFSKEEFYHRFSFSYQELYRAFDEEDYLKRQVIASHIWHQIHHFLEVCKGDRKPLTVKTLRYLESVAQLVFVHRDQTLNDFITVLSDYETRQSYIRRVESAPEKKDGGRLVSEEMINWVKRLDRFDDVKGQWGTNESEIKDVLDQFKGFVADPRIQQMFENPTTDVCDFEEAVLNPKIIMVRIPQQRNAVTGELGYLEENRAMIMSFITFKLWLVKELFECNANEDEWVENSLGERVKRKDLYVTHLIFDEIHQFPQFVEGLSFYLKEFRKFRLAPLLSCHGFTNLSKGVQREFAKLGAAYLCFSPIEVGTIDTLKSQLGEVDLSGIQDMERYQLAAYLPVGGSYVGVRAKTPGRVQDFLALEKQLEIAKSSKNMK